MTPRTAAPPQRVVLEGRYARLEPLHVRHAEDLFAAASVPDMAERFAYLPADPPPSVDGFRQWIASQSDLPDPILFAVVDRATGRAGGWQQLMRIVPEHGVIELGYIYWGPAIARTRIVTEGVYLTARHVFEDLGYRRFEWKCNDLNAPSRRAAVRFGFTFEGIFRQHMIVRGQNRDTAWFSMLDHEWPDLRAEYERWLASDNFDGSAAQKTSLRVQKPTADGSTYPSRTLSVTIDRDWRDVYAYASQPANLSAWASGLGSGVERSGDDWALHTPDGTPVRMQFAPDNAFGVLDHDVFAANGPIHVALRVMPNGAGAEVTFLLIQTPDLSDSEFERDAATVMADLRTLKTIMEGSTSP